MFNDQDYTTTGYGTGFTITTSSTDATLRAGPHTHELYVEGNIGISGSIYSKEIKDLKDSLKQAFEEIKTLKEVTMDKDVRYSQLWNVFLIYAENRANPFCEQRLGVIADSEEDAKLKSGLMQCVNAEWDTDYLNFICQPIGQVKTKPKPKEVKSVK